MIFIQQQNKPTNAKLKLLKVIIERTCFISPLIQIKIHIPIFYPSWSSRRWRICFIQNTEIKKHFDISIKDLEVVLEYQQSLQTLTFVNFKFLLLHNFLLFNDTFIQFTHARRNI